MTTTRSHYRRGQKLMITRPVGTPYGILQGGQEVTFSDQRFTDVTVHATFPDGRCWPVTVNIKDVTAAY